VDQLFKEFANLNKHELRMFHAYGPTEIKWTATTMELLYNDAKDMPARGNTAIGYPLPNYRVYVLDEKMNPAPPGVLGEIYVGGPGVSAGYLNNSALTAERLVPDTFASKEDLKRGWNTLHRTGDLGRWGDQGAVFIKGRTSGDTQVKIRGLRIDLLEVERALVKAAKGALSEAVVVPDSSSVYENLELLVAWVVFNNNHPES
jgi:hybrid polyketide synthase / nonribosomal peptide synthetase ACE1